MSAVKQYTTNEAYADLPYGTRVVLTADYDAATAEIESDYVRIIAAQDTTHRKERDALAAECEALKARVGQLDDHCKRLGQGDAERYWEGRWRDTEVEVARLRDLLRLAGWSMQAQPSCQLGLVTPCACRSCALASINAAMTQEPRHD